MRGINVGGRNLLPMADLAPIFAQAGCSRVRTYIQSGNVVYQPPASAAAAKRLPEHVGELIERRFRFRPAIIVRTGEELRDIIAANPFLKEGIDVALLHVAFSDKAPTKPCIGRLDPQRSPGDRFQVRGREMYLHMPNGVGRTRLTGPYVDSTLGVTSTWRNWRTVLKLAEMANEIEGAE